jgi:very-short-patch-repair endonuclease
MDNLLHNRFELKSTRKELRNAMTPAEAALWKALQGSQLDGRKFRRQHSVGPYVLDFYCSSERLAVELDGQGHYTVTGEARDVERTVYLAGIGIQVIRFENKVVVAQLEWVLEGIRQMFREKGADALRGS